MKGMFGMMNAARIGVGIQGIGIGEVALQNAASYARERLAMRSLTGPKNPDAPQTRSSCSPMCGACC